MAFTSTLPLYSHPKVIHTPLSFSQSPMLRTSLFFVHSSPYSKLIPKKQRLAFDALASDLGHRPAPDSASFITRGRRSRSERLVVTAAYGAEGGARRRVYRQSQQPITSAPVKQIATYVVPAGVFVAATFGMDFRFCSFLADDEFGRKEGS
ncbi:hypothetical protein V6N13_142659 [Hibiscus sabdariffa]